MGMSILRPAALATALALAASGLATLPAQADTLTANTGTINSATFSASPPPPGAPGGVSPEVYYDAATGTYYLLTTGQPRSVQYTSRDGSTWAPTSVQLPDRGIDWSIVQEGPSSYRLYYAEMAPTAPGSAPQQPCTPGSKVLKYATSTDLQTWTPQPGTLLGDVGCGVPHVMKTSAGRYFLYFNKAVPQEGVWISTSGDGLTWSEPTGPINGDDQLVDPAPVELPDGTFVMVGSTRGNPMKGELQYLQLLASSDAVTWVKRTKPLYVPSGAGAFDPSIELVDGKLRVWFGYSPGGSYDAAAITDGVLTLGPGKSSTGAGVKAKAGKKCAKKGATSGTLVCTKVKGKLIWKRR